MTYTVENGQYVIPGAEQISTRKYLARLAAKPISPRRGQVGLRGTTLFRGLK